MGVTGFSMGITSSTANGFSDCVAPPKRRTHLLPSSDGEGGNITVLGPVGKYAFGMNELLFTLEQHKCVHCQLGF